MLLRRPQTKTFQSQDRFLQWDCRPLSKNLSSSDRMKSKESSGDVCVKFNLFQLLRVTNSSVQRLIHIVTVFALWCSCHEQALQLGSQDHILLMSRLPTNPLWLSFRPLHLILSFEFPVFGVWVRFQDLQRTFAVDLYHTYHCYEYHVQEVLLYDWKRFLQ